MIHFHSSKILIPVDFSDTSLLAIKHGAFMAQTTKAELFFLHVVNTHYMAQNMFLPTVSLHDQSSAETKAMDKLNELGQEVKAEYNIEVQCIIKNGNPSIEVTKVAREIKASMVVMGSHGYSPIKEIMIGSVALKVITKSPCPTMVMTREASPATYKKIVMPIDNTVNSKQKVNFTLEMAKKFNATVYGLGLLTNEEKYDKPIMELVLHQVSKLAKEMGVSYQSETLNNVKNRATATVDFVEKTGADLIIIMTDQDAELSGFFLGPFSQQIIHISKVPVIAIKPVDLFVDDNNFPIPNTSGM
jgi:nucleotide-binding universal stress UspA family protein